MFWNPATSPVILTSPDYLPSTTLSFHVEILHQSACYHLLNVLLPTSLMCNLSSASNTPPLPFIQLISYSFCHNLKVIFSGVPLTHSIGILNYLNHDFHHNFYNYFTINSLSDYKHSQGKRPMYLVY